MIVRRYVLWRLAGNILAALAVLFALLQVLDLIDSTKDILDRGFGFWGILYYAVLRSPRLVEQAIPLAVLAGSLFAFAQLARENAINVMRASGISIYAILAMAAPATLAIVLVHVAIEQWIAPVTDTVLARWWNESAPPPGPSDAPEERTFRVGAELVTASDPAAYGTELDNIRIYRRGDDGRLTQRVAADKARFEGDGWHLTNPRTVSIQGDRASIETAPELDWSTTLRPADVQSTYGDVAAVSPTAARRALGEGAQLHSPAFYEMRLQRAWAAPIGSLIMMLLAAPIALANFRSASASIAIALSLAGGLLFLVADGLLAAIGESGAAPILLAAWAAPAIFASIGLTVLLRKEG